jgi:dCMP deaminase
MLKNFSKTTMKNKWEKRFIEMARLVSGWSKDPSTKVGAVIVRPDKTIASVGYNGIARGVKDEDRRIQNREQKLLYTVHAEQNAVLSAKEPLNGYSLYIWNIHPCAQCAASIIQTGIRNVFLPVNGKNEKVNQRWVDSFEAAEIMFREAKVKLTYIK